MIILSEAVEPKVSKATSTYPAVIVAVSSVPTSAFVTLQFFCPSTMSGQPYEALFANNNFVEAPVRPHESPNGTDIDYNFQVGDVIIISYSDGDLNSPQFVRYVDIGDLEREQNERYINGEVVVPDAVLKLTDSGLTLDSSLLVKSLNLLPAVRLAASGNTFSVLSMGTSKFRYHKCGIYGAEIIHDGRDNLLDTSKAYNLLYGNKNNITSPNISFNDIGCYFYNTVDEPLSTTIVDIYNKAMEDTVSSDTEFTKAKKDINTLLYLWQMLIGWNDYETGAKILNSSDYSDNKDKPKDLSYVDSFYDDIYGSSANIIKFRFDFWEQFDRKYAQQLDRAYAISLHNNIYRIKSSWELNKTTSQALLVSAVIATAFPILEQTIIKGTDAIVNDDSFSETPTYSNNKYYHFLQDLQTYAKNSAMLTSIVDKLANNFVDLYFYRLGFPQLSTLDDASMERTMQNSSRVKATIKSNIKSGINFVLNNYSTLFETFESNAQYTSETDMPQSVDKSLFTWPLPGYTHISSPFGYRSNVYDSEGNLKSSSGEHKGIDISGANVMGKTIVAADAGNVRIAGWQKSYGYTILIDHFNNGYTTRYAHCSKLLVNVGDNVTKGQAIALVGSTGDSTGAHLHFEIRYNNVPQNPLNYF